MYVLKVKLLTQLNINNLIHIYNQSLLINIINLIILII